MMPYQVTDKTNVFGLLCTKLLFYLLASLLIGGILSDCMSTWMHFHNSELWRASLVFRALMGVAITSVLIVHVQRWPNYDMWLLAAWWISMVFLWFGYAHRPIANMDNYMQSTVQLYKMIYPVLLFVALRLVLLDRPFYGSKLFAILDIVLAVYLFFIFFGLFSGSEMFRTYWDGLRPGFKGIIMTQNEATGTILVAVFWFGLRYFSGQRHVLFFVVSILAALILGTKGVLLALPLILAGMYWARFGMLKMVPVAGLVIGVFTIVAILAYQYSGTIHAGVVLFTNYMAAHSTTDSIQEIIAMLTSGRSDRLISFLPTIVNDLSPGVLFGGFPIAYGSMEIDPIDAFLRGGFLFLALLLVAYWKMFRFSGGTGGARYKLVLFVIWMGIAFTGGHLWMAATTAPMLVIALAYAGQMQERGKLIPSSIQQPVSSLSHV